MKKKKESAAGWYHDSCVDGFNGIFYCDDENGPTTNERTTPWGPFKTFGEAKADAIDYFRTDIREAKRHIMDVKSFKKEQAND